MSKKHHHASTPNQTVGQRHAPKQFRTHQSSPRNLPRIDFKNNFRDYQVILLTVMGFSRRFVAQQTKLEPHQCDYRCSLAGITRKAYRDGFSDFATSNIDTMMDTADRFIRKGKVV